ncbi:MAG: hypothetical protein ABIN67_02555 [Ferruginibacter sp.]
MLDKKIGVDELIVCLYDGHYHFGVAALVNSLVKSNFKGFIHIGYRGVLPPWVKQLQMIDDSSFFVTNDVVIHFEMIDTDINLAFYKPYFIAKTFRDHSLLNRVFYFDVDIVVNAPWSFFSSWLEDEVCLCLDSNYEYVHSNHPWRKDWKKLANVDTNFCNTETAYVNSGFIGITKHSMPLIEKWMMLTDKFAELGGSLKKFFQDGHISYKGDQDLLNAAITVSPNIKLSLIGKEGMGFTQPAYLMTHATSKDKPWDKNFVRNLFKYGKKPSFSEKNFFNYCKYPINLFPAATLLTKKINLFLATVLGRLIGY